MTEETLLMTELLAEVGDGALQLRIPKLRHGGYFPPFQEPGKTSEKAAAEGVLRQGQKPRPLRRRI